MSVSVLQANQDSCKSRQTIALPRLRAVNEVVGKPVGKRLRVLIADDTATIRVSLSALVSRLHNVEVIGLAENGTQALELIRSLKPDVATLDIRMPGLNGIKVLETLRREQLELTIIVLTGLDEAEYRRRCFDIGADYFFHKATEFEKVIDVLKERALALNGGELPASAG